MSTELDDSRDGATVSIVIPVYLNSATLRELNERLLATARFPFQPQIIYVDDASPDDSAEVLAQLETEHPEVCTHHLPVNGGQQNAIRAGLKRCTGDVIVVMDADLQDMPESIAEMYEALQASGCQAVFAQRTERYQKGTRMLSSRLFKWLIKKIVGLPRGTGTFLIMRRRMQEQVLAFQTQRFYLPGLVAKTGLPITTVAVERSRRPHGQSAYNSWMRLDVAISNISCLLERNH